MVLYPENQGRGVPSPSNIGKKPKMNEGRACQGGLEWQCQTNTVKWNFFLMLYQETREMLKT